MIDEADLWRISVARRWSEEIRGAAMRLAQREALLEEMVERYDGLKAIQYDKIGGSSGAAGDDSIARFIDEVEKTREYLTESMSEYREAIKEYGKSLRKIDPFYDQILFAHYVRNVTWADEAYFIGYSPSRIRHLAQNALRDLYDVMPKDKKGEIPRAL